GLTGLVERVDQIVADDFLDEVKCEPAADNCGRGERLVRLGWKSRKPAAYRFSYSLRQRARVPTAPTLVDVAQRLDEEERIAPRHRRQCASKLFVVVAGFGHVRGHVVLVEAAEVDAAGGAVAVKVGEHGRQRM